MRRCDARAAGFTRADRQAFRRASIKTGYELTAQECDLFVRYYYAGYQRTGQLWRRITAGAYSIKLERIMAGGTG